jgi:hypothetical protein
MSSIKLKTETKLRLKRMRELLTVVNFAHFSYDEVISFLLGIVEGRLKEASQPLTWEEETWKKSGEKLNKKETHFIKGEA